VIVVARTANQARRVLGHQHWRPLMHVALCPMARRRAAIPRLLDEHLAARGSVLRFADLTPHNQKALLYNPWRENLLSLRETAVRLDAIVTSGFSRRKAAEMLGIVRQTFYHWYAPHPYSRGRLGAEGGSPPSTALPVPPATQPNHAAEPREGGGVHEHRPTSNAAGE